MMTPSASIHPGIASARSVLQMPYVDGTAVLEKITALGSAAIRSFNQDLNAELSPQEPLRTPRDQFGQVQPHATTRYAPLILKDWLNAVRDVHTAKNLGAAKINFHLPDEIELDSRRDLLKGERFMDFVDAIGAASDVRVVWENSYRADTTDFACLENQSCIPDNRMLCLDIGHLILLSQDRSEALARIDNFLDRHGPQISHLHLHINDLVHDLHWNDPKIVKDFLATQRFQRLNAGWNYIF
jgi:hypothetical protein